MNRPRQCVALMLAAGASTRLGRPKQLLPFRGKTLIKHTIDVLLQTDVLYIAVVTGAQSGQIRNILPISSTPRIRLIENENWSTGQSSSLSLGLSTIHRAGPDTDVLVSLCDQPLIPSCHYQQLITQVRSGTLVAATRYETGGGVPVCFAASIISEVLANAQSQSTRDWISRQPASHVSHVPCEQALIDIDTQDDYQTVL